jgi:hypothetical protein
VYEYFEPGGDENILRRFIKNIFSAGRGGKWFSGEVVKSGGRVRGVFAAPGVFRPTTEIVVGRWGFDFVI